MPPSLSKDEKNSEETSDASSDQQFLVKKAEKGSVLKAGLSCKASPFLADSWISLCLTLDGRDKVTKVLQYTSRLLAFLSTAGSHEQKRWHQLFSKLSGSRKAFRVGRSFIELQKLRKMGIWVMCLQTLGLSKSSSKKSSMSLIELGQALKMVGLVGFWAGDNTSFFNSAGFLDDYTLDEGKRREQRISRQRNITTFTNRSYFFGSVAGLVANFKSYVDHQSRELKDAHQQYDNAKTEEDQLVAQKNLEIVQKKHFGLLVAFIKSCCDVMVFGNNAGVDLFKRFYGRKLHEGVHCVGGLISAATVLYNNYPNA